jgi:hypothetical protein
MLRRPDAWGDSSQLIEGIDDIVKWRLRNRDAISRLLLADTGSALDLPARLSLGTARSEGRDAVWRGVPESERTGRCAR